MTEKTDRKVLGIISFVAVLALIWLFQSFLLVIIFAGIYAISTYPIFNALTGKFSETISSLLMCIGSFLFVVLPLIYLISVSVMALNRELPNLISQIQMIDIDSSLNTIQSYLAQIPLINQWLDLDVLSWTEFDQEIKALVMFSSQYLIQFSSLLIGSLTSFITLGLFLFILFFFYKDANQITLKIKVLLPTSLILSEKITTLFESLCSIYLVNVLILALIQGFGFAVVVSFFDLPPAYLGLLFTLASFIPVIGTLLVWLPLVIYLTILDQNVAAISITFYSLVISGGLIDYFLRAKVINQLSAYYPNQNIKQSGLVVILSTLAGIIEFGVLGLILGPLVASSALGLIHFYLESKSSKRLS